MLGKGGAGKVRMAQVDEKTKVRISKTLQKNIQRQQAYGGSTTVKRQISGTASSIAFTPLQVRVINRIETFTASVCVKLVYGCQKGQCKLMFCFNLLQGLEIVNPSAAEKKVVMANAKYFSNTGLFHNVTKDS